MSHRLREAMRGLQMDPLGGGGKEVEADETYFAQKRPKVALVQELLVGGEVEFVGLNQVFPPKPLGAADFLVERTWAGRGDW